MRLLVCGSRSWSWPELLIRTLDGHLEDIREHFEDEPVTIVEGEADGADKMAATWAALRRLDVERHPADWSQGRGAGFKRNAEMIASGVDAVIAFSTTDPATRGTAHTCRLAIEQGLPVFFVTPDGRQRRYQQGEPMEEL